MRIEGAAGEADVGGAVVAEAPHQFLAAADHADGEAAGEALAVGHHVGANAEIFLGAAGGEAEADEDFVEDQHDAALGADLAQLLQPFGVGRAIERALARTVDERGIAGRVGVGVQRLQRIDQHAGDVLARAQHVQRPLRHVGQRIGLVRRHRIADAGLHVAPPAVIGAGEANQMRALGVVARQPHRLHDRFGAGHVERDFVEAGNLAQPLHVLGDDGMVGAEHGAERVRALLGFRDALLVEVVAKNVDAVGAGQVVEHIAVDIGDGDAGGGLHEGAGAEIFPHQPAVLERHPVAFGELQVGDVRRRLGRHLPALGVALLIEAGEPEEGVLALHGDVAGRAVGTEEAVDIEFVMRQQPRDHFGHFGMSGQRAVLGARQRQPRLQFGEDCRGASDRSGGQRKNWKGRIHA